MSEKGYKGGLVSRVRNQHSGRRFVISTAQEVGKDYWTTGIFPGVFFGLFPKVTRPAFVIIRNNKQDAHDVHWEVKRIVTEVSESDWPTQIPYPKPFEGYSEDALNTLHKKQGR